MLRRIKALIHRRSPTLAFWLGQMKADLTQRTRVRTPMADNEVGERRRLLIDVTHTSTAGYLSGIQRVVLRLTQQLVATADRLPFEPVLVRLESCGGGELQLARAIEFEARVGRIGDFPEPRIGIRQNDILLMLDSSWIEYPLFAKAIFPALKSRGGKVVSCVYDLIPITHPQFCVKQLVVSFRRWVTIMLRSSDAILCISKATESSLQAHLAARSERFAGDIDHFHLGSDFQLRRCFKAERTSDVPTVLMVGTLEPRKGYDVAFAAFQRLWARGLRIRLHIFGRFGWSIEDLVEEMRASPALDSDLILTSNGSDEKLEQAYDAADLVLSASYVEGFGLPLVEAAAFGKPLMVSEIAAYREVCGNDAIYFTPGDADDLAAKLEAWLSDRPAIRPPTFISWEESSQQLIDRISLFVGDQGPQLV